MKIIADFSNQKAILQKKEGEKVYCTVDGVLQEVVYSKVNENQVQYYENVRLTKQTRLRLQQSASSQPSFNISQLEAATTIYPTCIFDYSKLIIERSKLVEYWGSSVDNLNLSQSTSANKPQLGFKGTGINGYAPLYFNSYESKHLSLNSSILVRNDFTMFFYIQPIANPLHKNYRLLGNSANADMYLTIGEAINESYKLSFSSISSVTAPVSGYWQPSSKKLLITLQRKDSTLYIRENGVQVYTTTVPTSDFTFDQFGIIGSSTSPSFNGTLYHFSLYDGYLDRNLSKIENAIINNAQLASE